MRIWGESIAGDGFGRELCFKNSENTKSEINHNISLGV